MCNISTGSRGYGGSAGCPDAPSERAQSRVNVPARAAARGRAQRAESGGAHCGRNGHYLTLPYLTLPYLTYLTLPYLTVPYLTLPYLTICYITAPQVKSNMEGTSLSGGGGRRRAGGRQGRKRVFTGDAKLDHDEQIRARKSTLRLAPPSASTSAARANSRELAVDYSRHMTRISGKLAFATR